MALQTYKTLDLERIDIIGGLTDAKLLGILQSFVDELANYSALIEKSWRRGDVNELLRVLHRLKGAARTCGFVGIAEAAAQWHDSQDPLADEPQAELEERIRRSVADWNELLRGANY